MAKSKRKTRKAPKAPQKMSLLERAALQPSVTLWVYLCIFVGCAATMLWNMTAHQVAFGAVMTGPADARNLALLTGAVVVFCAVCVVLLAVVLLHKARGGQKQAKTKK